MDLLAHTFGHSREPQTKDKTQISLSTVHAIMILIVVEQLLHQAVSETTHTVSRATLLVVTPLVTCMPVTHSGMGNSVRVDAAVMECHRHGSV